MAKKAIVLLALGLAGYVAATGLPQHGASAATAAPDASAWFSVRGKVTRIVDGDTIHVRIGKKTEKVRFLGIDAAEVGTRAPKREHDHVDGQLTRSARHVATTGK